MAKAVFGEFSAYTTPGGVRFMKNGKLASEPTLPPEVVSYLRNQLEGERGQVQEQPEQPAQTFPRPSEEELAKMRAESAAQLAGQPGEEVKTLASEQPQEVVEPLNPNDFFDEEPAQETVQQVQEQLPPDSSGQFPTPEPTEPVRPPEQPVDSDFLETVSIYTASLRDIAQALYDRFGIYTVYTGELPRADEVNPLTGVQFTKYHLGIAYQAAIFAKNQGILEQEPEASRRAIDEGRAASANFQTDPVPTTMADNRQANSFAFRTSVRGTQTQAATRIEHVVGDDGKLHAVQVAVTNPDGEENPNGTGQRYDREQEELIVEPPMSMGARPIIRPNW